MSQSGVYGSGGGGGGGSMVLIQTQTATSATAIAFTSGITGIYNNYKIFYDNVALADTTTYVLAQLSIDGGSTYINTNYLFATNAPSAGLTVVSAQGNGGDIGFTYGNTDLYNVTSGSNYVTASTIGIAFFDVTSTLIVQPASVVSAYTVPGTTVNAFQLVTDDGAAFSGTFSLYGIVM